MVAGASYEVNKDLLLKGKARRWEALVIGFIGSMGFLGFIGYVWFTGFIGFVGFMGLRGLGVWCLRGLRGFGI